MPGRRLRRGAPRRVRRGAGFADTYGQMSPSLALSSVTVVVALCLAALGLRQGRSRLHWTFVMAAVSVAAWSAGMAGREIVHEFIQHDANAENLASFVESVMTDEVRRNELERNLLETGALLGERGAARRAAEAIVDLLES